MSANDRVRTFRDLVAWQKAMGLITMVYAAIKSFPKEEVFGLTAQIRRAAISVPSNTAEGFGRRTTEDFIRFLQMALGSLFETQTQLEVAHNLGYVNPKAYDSLYEETREVERILTALIRSLKKS